MTRFLSSKGSSILSIFFIYLALILSVSIFFDSVLEYNVIYLRTINNFALALNLNSIPYILVFDTLTSVMLLIILSVSLFVHIFSYEYMKKDPRLNIFFSYISLFTFFMIILVSTGSFFHMFFGWEGVGLCSYLLINFWSTRLQANKSAIKAMLVNRVGDLSLTLGLLLIYTLFKTLNYGSIFCLAPYFKDAYFIFFNFKLHALTLISLLLFFGAVGKSAQIGLHTWLPDAMEGPTPVSALIHAATMVTAGVFLLVRSSPILEYSNLSLSIITFFGAFTCYFAASTGLFQNDLKKVIAYSTCSQLGYMVFACGLSNYQVAVFHLSNHAFFKALLFLTAGCIIHALNDEQDMRRMGGLFYILPLSSAMITIGSLALIGFPFLTGFYSKDFILEVAYSNSIYNLSFDGLFCFWLGLAAAFNTAFYSTRLFILTFLNKSNSFKSTIKQSHESSLGLFLPLILLAFGSIFLGYFSKDFFIGLGTPFWGNSIFIKSSHFYDIEAEFGFFISNLRDDHNIINYKLLPFFFTICGVLISLFFYISSSLIYTHFKFITNKSIPFSYEIQNFFNKKWFFDRIYNEFLNLSVFQLSYNQLYFRIDKGFIEFLGPYGLSSLVYYKSILFLNTTFNTLTSQLFIIPFIFFFLFLLYCFNINISFIFVWLLYFINYHLYDQASK